MAEEDELCVSGHGHVTGDHHQSLDALLATMRQPRIHVPEDDENLEDKNKSAAQPAFCHAVGDGWCSISKTGALHVLAQIRSTSLAYSRWEPTAVELAQAESELADEFGTSALAFYTNCSGFEPLSPEPFWSRAVTSILKHFLGDGGRTWRCCTDCTFDLALGIIVDDGRVRVHVLGDED